MKQIAVVFLIVILCAAFFMAGFSHGVRHVIEDSEIWTVDRYDPDDPESSAWNGFDQRIFITLDGETYMHGVYQG